MATGFYPNGEAIVSPNKGRGKRRLKKLVHKTKTMSYFSRILGNLSSGKRTYSIFGNKLGAPPKQLPAILNEPFAVRAKSSNTREEERPYAQKMKLAVRKVKAKVKVASILGQPLTSNGRTRSIKPAEKRDSTKPEKYNSKGIEKLKRAARHLNRLAHMVHFYHYETDEHHEEADNEKQRSLTQLLAALQNYYDPDREHTGNYHYSDINLLRRESIRWHPRVRNILLQLWDLVSKDAHGTIGQDGYIEMCLKVYRALVDDSNSPEIEELRIEHAIEDWETDHMGYGCLDKARFARAWFQLADHWTHEICVDSYANFLGSVYFAISETKFGSKRFRQNRDIVNHKVAQEMMDSEIKTQVTLKDDNRHIAVKVHKRTKNSPVTYRVPTKQLEQPLEYCWANSNMKEVYHRLENSGDYDDTLTFRQNLMRRTKNGLFVGSTLPPPEGWENFGPDDFSRSFMRLQIDGHKNEALDQHVRSRSFIVRKLIQQGGKGAKVPPPVLDERQMFFQQLILMEMKVKYGFKATKSTTLKKLESKFGGGFDANGVGVLSPPRLKQVFSKHSIEDRNDGVDFLFASRGRKTQSLPPRPQSAPGKRRNTHILLKSLGQTEPGKRHMKKRRPSSANVRKRFGKKSTGTSEQDAEVGGLVVIPNPEKLFKTTGEQKTNKKRKKKKKKRKANLKKLTPAQKLENRKNAAKRSIQIDGIKSSIPFGSIRSTFGLMGMNVQRIKRLSENTVFVTFSCHTDFRKAIRLLSIVAKDTREKVKPSKGSYYSRMAEYEKIFEEQFIASLERPYNED